MSGYVVVDFETTGFSPEMQDRVIEIGCVLVDEDGAIEEHWSTLINPERDMRATLVHGITAADVEAAPTFRQIAPRLLQDSTGRTLVAHNARFDLSFLESELLRAGYPHEPEMPYLCTMEWSQFILEGASRKLADCCRLAGVANKCGHSAEGDAMATAGLLAFYLRAGGQQHPLWGSVLAATMSYRWPAHPITMIAVALKQRVSQPVTRDAWLDLITSKAPRLADPAVEAYVDVLERALLDGYLSAHEKDDLGALAKSLGLPDERLDKVHRRYLSAVACAAWADGVITMEEQFQLSQVAASLGIPSADAKQILLDAQGQKAPFRVETLHLSPGDRVAFTSGLSVPRDDWIARIKALGIEHGAVNNTVRLLVAADPDSEGIKARKARQFGVPIITESAFELAVSELEARRAARSSAMAD